MQQITLKRSTIAAMNQAFQSYCKAIDQQERSGLDVEGVTKDLNGYLLMLFCERLMRYSGKNMTSGEAVLYITKLQMKFKQLDDD